MANLNKAMLIGRLTRDPELRYTQTGTAICKIGLAVNRTWRGQDGEKQEDTAFIDVTFFGKQAETLGQYMTKGRELYVEGRLELDQWEGKDGQKRSKLGVVGEGFQFLGGERGGSGGGPPQRQQAQARSTPEPPGGELNLDDIPF